MIPSTLTQRARAIDSIQHVISKVEYYDSPFGVASSGMYFALRPISKITLQPTGNIHFDGYDNILSHNFGEGSAFGGPSIDYFKITWTGYFYSEFETSYDLIVNKDETSSGYIALGGNAYSINPGIESKLITGVNLTQGWHSLSYDYSEMDTDAYTSVLFKPSGSEYFRPFSAGCVNRSPNFIPATTLKAIKSINGSYGVGKSTQYTFTVPLTKSPESLVSDLPISGNTIVYFFNPQTKSYTMREFFKRPDGSRDHSDCAIKMGRLIKIYAGYQSLCTYAGSTQCNHPSPNITGYYNSLICTAYGLPLCPGNTATGTDYVQRFDGVITNFNVIRGNVEDELEIQCQDALRLLQDNFDKNYPDTLSYLNTALHVAPPSGVKFLSKIYLKKSRPRAYDSWPIGFALRDIFMNAGIDPTKLFASRLYTSYAGNNIYMGFVKDYIEKYLDYINLTRNVEFGNPIVPGALTVDDDKYIWTTNFGDMLDDVVKRIIDSYGFYLSIKNDGNVEVLRIMDDGIAEFAPGIPTYDGRAGRGFYTSTATTPLSATVTGGSIYVKTMIDSGASIQVSSFRITKDASPSIKLTKWENTFPVNIFYGALNGPSGVSWNKTNYTKTRFGLSITSGIDVSGIKFSLYSDTTRGGYPLSGGLRTDYCPNLKCDIYFGPTSWTAGMLPSITGIAANKIKSDYRVPDFGLTDFSKSNVFVDMDFDKVVHTTGGLYVLEIIATGNNEELPAGFGNGRYISLNSFKYNGTTDPFPYYTILVSGISDQMYSGYSDTGAYGTNYRVYNDIEFRNFYPPTMPQTVVLVYTGSKIIYSGMQRQYASGTKELFFVDGPDEYNDFQQLIKINPWDLTPVSSTGGFIDSYNEYIVEVFNTSALGKTSVESITSIPYSNNQTWYFDTAENVTNLTIGTNYENIRNDVVVIGNLKSVETDMFTGQVINKNNPSYIYTYSRAIDIDSIYSLNNPENIGRPKEFIILEPGIKTQYHADWLALSVLTKYHRNKNEASIDITAVPFLEPLDPVYMTDSKTNSLDIDRLQYIDSVDEKIEVGSYTMRVGATPYKPWDSFNKSIIPIVSSDKQAFTNVLITKTNGLNVQTGDLVIGQVSGAYNCYESERTGDARTLVRIQWSQNAEGFTLVRIMDSVWGRPVAYLVGSIENGEEVPEYTNYDPYSERLWNGIDELGISKVNPTLRNDPMITGFVVSPQSANFFAFPGRYYVDFKIEDPFDPSLIYHVESRALDPTNNPEASGIVVIGTNGTLDHHIDLEWSPMGDAMLCIKSRSVSMVGGLENENYYPGKNDGIGSRGGSTVSKTNIDNWENISQSDYSPTGVCSIFFTDDENAGDGLKFKAYVDTGTVDPYRVYTVKAKIVHEIHSAIYVLPPTGDYIKQATINGNVIYDPAMDGTIIAMRKRYAESNANDFRDVYDVNFRDQSAMDNKTNSYKLIDTMDYNGYRAIAFQSDQSDTIDVQYATMPLKYQLDEVDRLELQTTPILDRNMFEFSATGGIAADLVQRWVDQRSENWSSKFLFTRTPIESITDEEFLPETKFRFSEDMPYIEFKYNPKNFKNGSINYYELPQFDSTLSMDKFKQTLREALNIAKWHYIFDTYPILLVFNGPGHGDNTDDMGPVREIMADSTCVGTYWRSNPDIAKYIGIALFHVFKFEVQMYDNSGRGLLGASQPAREYVGAMRPSAERGTFPLVKQNILNQHEWRLVIGRTGNNYIEWPQNIGPALFGYDKFNNKNSLVFHAYWVPNSDATQAELSAIGLSPMDASGYTAVRPLQGFPSQFHKSPIGLECRQPYFAAFCDYNRFHGEAGVRALTTGGGTDTRQWGISIGENNTNIDRYFEYTYVMFSEGFGLGVSNRWGSLRGRTTWNDEDRGSLGFGDTLNYTSRYSVVPDIMDGRMYNWLPGLLPEKTWTYTNSNGATVLYRGLAQGLGFSYGSLWHMFRLPNGFTFDSLNQASLWGIPNRGVKVV